VKSSRTRPHDDPRADDSSQSRNFELDLKEVPMRVADGGLSGRPIHCEAAEVYRSVISMAQGLTLRVDQVLDVC
jgi:hypothetical protein